MLKRLIKTISEFADSISKDHMGAFAAQSAFFILLSIFPIINIILAFIKFLPMTEKDFVDFISKLMPDGANNTIVGIVGEIYDNSAGTLTIVSLVIGLWSAAKGIMAIRNGLNEVYKAKTKVNFLIQRLISSFYTMIIVIAVLATSLISVFGDQAVDRCQFLLAQVAIIQVLLGEFRKHWGIVLVEANSVQPFRHPIILLVLVLIPVYCE